MRRISQANLLLARRARRNWFSSITQIKNTGSGSNKFWSVVLDREKARPGAPGFGG